ncbi:Pisatin demethylase [Diaporthe amygdali]|uniref:Pisatin demethylase n=1 Tax=Phomopsis amygdali TaxID=1214568 RepID=UPI0022FE1218|nr:Pisatin demethylase [Diaporthe amygdali]KAJ0117715.1 Pisatin demethylase [Diaporthe amygdali]
MATFPVDQMSNVPIALQVLGSVLVAVLSILIWRRYLSPLRDIPGPFAASFTRLWHMKRILKGDQNLELIRLHEKYGHFVRIAPDEVSVSHPDGLRKVLLTPLRKGDWYKIVHFPDRRFKNPMGETDPATKNELSKHVASGYLLSNLLQAEPAVDDTIELLLGWLDKHVDERKPLDLDRFFTYTTFDVVGEVIFSKSFGFLREGKDIGGAIANSLAQNIYVAVGGYMQWFHLLLSNPLVTWLDILPFGHIIDTAMGAIKEREKNPEARFDAVAHWFRYLEQNPDRMTAREIQSAAANAVAAGADTVACGLQSFVYHMIRRPDLWQRVRKEIDDAGLSAPGMQKKVVPYSEAQKLLLLQACIKEALRVFSPAPMGLPRVVGEGGVTIGDRTFPEGTTLSVSAWVIHHSKEFWGAGASEFRPERWLAGAKSAALDKYYMPFGLGYMSCPGQNITKIELSKICATIVRDYDIRQVDSSQEWQWKPYFTVAPHSWPCYVEKRQ